MVDIFVLILKLENENRAVNNSPKFMWLPPGQRRETWVNRLPVHSLNYCIITTTPKGAYHRFTKK